MRCFWCILLAFCILSCGGNSTGPEPEPITEPEPQYKELSYENLTGSWVDSNFYYSLGTRVDSSFSYVHPPMMGFYENFSGKYFLNDPYIGIRGIFGWGLRREYPEYHFYFYLATVTDSILSLRNVPEAYLREALSISDTTGVTPVVMSMSGEEFASVLDSLKTNTRGQIIPANNSFQLLRIR
ncbi:MAG: hypothetical protein F4Y79_00545 [Gemmatimonadetes bacterium]|nr:hypothetical protein [Gemmatimonadota bacterium]